MVVLSFILNAIPYAVNTALAFWFSSVNDITTFNYVVSFILYFVITAAIKYSPLQGLHLILSQILFCIILHITFGHLDILGIFGPLLFTIFNFFVQTSSYVLALALKRMIKHCRTKEAPHSEKTDSENSCDDEDQ